LINDVFFSDGEGDDVIE
jgi:hypothetical protein